MLFPLKYKLMANPSCCWFTGYGYFKGMQGCSHKARATAWRNYTFRSTEQEAASNCFLVRSRECGDAFGDSRIKETIGTGWFIGFIPFLIPC